MTDLTAITTPFGLLDRETQEALKAHGGPWEYFGPGGDWRDWTNSTNPWFPELAYRVKPAPPKPRTIYLCDFMGHQTIHATAIDATKAALAYENPYEIKATVSEWREVLE